MPTSPAARGTRPRPKPLPRQPRAGPAPAETTLTDRAYTAIEELIVRLELAPGSAVSEAMLSQRLKIGRTPIREALQRLARERLVRILPRRGVIVAEIDVRGQLRLLEVRRELERLIARAAARRASEDERARFAAIAEAFETAAASGDDIAFLRTDREFNELALASSRNEFAQAAMALMASLSRRFWYLHYREAADMPLAAKLHADVARGIAGGDAAAAASASDTLLDYIEAFTRTTVTGDF
ncbi:MAG: GntR family transcriptional regulator [Burkholderiales bacterium]|nr:GntR family transcriptional regulator [Burkholderiales bacterium]